jgi:uncharacterized membrane protein
MVAQRDWNSTQRAWFAVAALGILFVMLEAVLLVYDPSEAGAPLGMLLIAGLLLLYLLPAIVGHKKRNASAIMVLNLFLGWTLVGWVVALVWATTTETPVPPVIGNQITVPSIGPSLFCVNCGKYSHPGSKFCSICGAQFA